MKRVNKREADLHWVCGADLKVSSLTWKADVQMKVRGLKSFALIIGRRRSEVRRRT
jgi:hypothetical protein